MRTLLALAVLVSVANAAPFIVYEFDDNSHVVGFRCSPTPDEDSRHLAKPWSSSQPKEITSDTVPVYRVSGTDIVKRPLEDIRTAVDKIKSKRNMEARIKLRQELLAVQEELKAKPVDEDLLARKAELEDKLK